MCQRSHFLQAFLYLATQANVMYPKSGCSEAAYEDAIPSCLLRYECYCVKNSPCENTIAKIYDTSTYQNRRSGSTQLAIQVSSPIQTMDQTEVDEVQAIFNSTMTAENMENALDSNGEWSSDNDIISMQQIDPSCIAEKTHLRSPGGLVAVEDLSLGDFLTTMGGGVTTVTRISRSVAKCNDLHTVSGVNLTAKHAIRVDDKRWMLASDIGESVGPDCGSVVVYAIETLDYCNDVLVTDTGLAIESWDGRHTEAWRPHYLLKDGSVARCALQGSALESFYYAVDATKSYVKQVFSLTPHWH